MVRIKSAIDRLFSWSGTLIVLLAVMVYSGLMLWPPTYWYRPGPVVVFDSLVGEPVYMHFDREIRRGFFATWATAVRKASPTGWEVTCAASGAQDYRVDTQLPDPLTLRWWSDGKCSNIDEPGNYFVSTVWHIHPWLGPEKVVRVDSNFFTVVNPPVLEQFHEGG